MSFLFFDLLSDKQLLQLCFLTCLIGFGLIGFFSFDLQPTKVSVSSLDDSLEGQLVELQGSVSSYKFLNDVLVFDLFNLKTISVVLFEPDFLDLDLVKSKPFLKVVGILSKKGKNFELTAKSIEVAE